MGIIKLISKRDRGRTFFLSPAAAKRAIPINHYLAKFNLGYRVEKGHALSVI